MKPISEWRSDVVGRIHFVLVLMLGLAGCGGGAGGSDTGGGNRPPVPVAACNFTPTDQTVTGQLQASDPNNDALAFAIVQPGALGRAESDVAGNFRYTPDAGARGRDTFTFRVTDTAGNQATADVTMIVGHTRIMPLGDSITAGVTYGGGACINESKDTNCPPEDQRVGYRKRLYDELTAAGYYVSMVGGISTDGGALLAPPNNRHEGHGGFQDSQVRDGVRGWLDASPPDIVLLHIGTNGINEEGGTSAIDTAGATNSILERIFGQWVPANHPITVFLAKIIGSPTIATNDNVISFNADLENHVVQNWRGQLDAGRLRLVDMYNALPERSTSNGGDFADQLHPNDTGYRKMADVWRAQLVASGLLSRCP